MSIFQTKLSQDRLIILDQKSRYLQKEAHVHLDLLLFTSVIPNPPYKLKFLTRILNSEKHNNRQIVARGLLSS